MKDAKKRSWITEYKSASISSGPLTADDATLVLFNEQDRKAGIHSMVIEDSWQFVMNWRRMNARNYFETYCYPSAKHY